MINRVVLVGRLTKDVEVRKTASGLSVAGFTVACDRNRSRSQDDNGQQQADFINCTAWRQTADFLGMYAKKGAMVGVDGRIQTRSYDGQDGRRVYVTEVVADSVQLLESRSTSQARAQQAPQNSFQQPYQQQSYGPQNDFNSYAGNNANNGYNNNGGYGNSNGFSNFSNNSYNNGGYGGNNSGNNSDYDADGGLDISSDDLPF